MKLASGLSCLLLLAAASAPAEQAAPAAPQKPAAAEAAKVAPQLPATAPGSEVPVATQQRFSQAASDRVAATTSIPDPSRKVGEVRLVERGEVTVVQTLLWTKLLSRVLSEIRSKEGSNWPPGTEGTQRYLAALDAAKETLEARRDENGDRRRRLFIEFAADKTDSLVLIGTFETDPEEKKITPRERRLFQVLALPRDYVLRNMRLILADSFRIAEGEVERLGPLGPAALAAGAPRFAPVPAPEVEPEAAPEIEKKGATN